MKTWELNKGSDGNSEITADDDREEVMDDIMYELDLDEWPEHWTLEPVGEVTSLLAERKALTDALAGCTHDGFPGSAEYKSEMDAVNALEAFDETHTEVIADIRQRRSDRIKAEAFILMQTRTLRDDEHDQPRIIDAALLQDAPDRDGCGDK